MLTERLFEQSDPFVATVCAGCGYLAHPVADKTLLRHKKPFCKVCNSSEAVRDVRMPYAFKLLLQELMAMNISARLGIKDCPEKGTTEASRPQNAYTVNVPHQ